MVAQAGSVCNSSDFGSVSPLLGIHARFASTALQSGVSEASVSEVFLDRDKAARLLSRFALQAAARSLLPRERVSKCLRAVVPGRVGVDVLFHPERVSGGFGGLQVCSSVWACPVCAAKISERRRLDLDQAVQNWFAAGGYVLLVTFTVQHSAADALPLLQSALQSAYRAFVSGRWYQDLKKEYGIEGTIKALEVTYGANGFHPHIHCLVFTRSGLYSQSLFSDEVRCRWASVLSRFGRSASYEYGVDVRSANAEIADYVAKFGREKKWTIGSEITKSVVKRSKSAVGVSMTELLAMYAFTGDKDAGSRWLQYAVTFKGERQLRWSPKLRGVLLPGSEEKTDEQVALEQSDMAVLLATLTRSQWAYVLGNDARADLLQVAALGDVSALWSFLNDIGIYSNSFNQSLEVDGRGYFGAGPGSDALDFWTLGYVQSGEVELLGTLYH